MVNEAQITCLPAVCADYCAQECQQKRESNCGSRTSNGAGKDICMPSSSYARSVDLFRGRSEMVLDNPVWHSLATAHAHLSEGNGRAKRFLPEISPLAGTADLDDETYLQLAAMVSPGQVAAVLRDAPVSSLPGFEIVHRISVDQMVWEGGSVSVANPGIVLGSGDAPEMLTLTELTKPGPFTLRTHELGRYIGIRKSGQLAAMAGERMRMPGFTEVSAVCTHPDHRGHGYASQLVLAMVTTIMERGDVPFLHVASENASAIKVYEKLGFRRRRVWHFVVGKKKT